MSKNAEIYNYWNDVRSSLEEIDSIVKRIREIETKIKENHLIKNFRDGRYETWVKENEMYDEMLKKAKDELKIEPLEKLYELIPLENCEFDHKQFRFKKENGIIFILSNNINQLVSSDYKKIYQYDLNLIRALFN